MKGCNREIRHRWKSRCRPSYDVALTWNGLDLNGLCNRLHILIRFGIHKIRCFDERAGAEMRAQRGLNTQRMIAMLAAFHEGLYVPLCRGSISYRHFGHGAVKIRQSSEKMHMSANLGGKWGYDLGLYCGTETLLVMPSLETWNSSNHLQKVPCLRCYQPIVPHEYSEHRTTRTEEAYRYWMIYWDQ